MGNVFSFNTTETSAIDTDPIQRLKREVGEKRCRTLVDGMIFDVTDLLCKIERATFDRDFEDVLSQIPKVQDVSNKLGLICLVDVCSDLSEALTNDDLVATAAISARLIRLGEDSLFSLIEFTNRSIV